MTKKLIPLFLILVQFTACSDNSQETSNNQTEEYTQIDFDPAFSADGSKIVYAHSNPDNDISGIYIADNNGTNKIQLISGFSRCPSFSPDNEWILFSQFDRIYKVKQNGDSLIQLTSSGKNFFPEFSSDGKMIVYINSDCGGAQCGLWIMNSDGEQKMLIENDVTHFDLVNASNSIIYFIPSKNESGVQNGDTLIQYFFGSSSRQVLRLLNGNEHKVNSYICHAGDEIIFCSMNESGNHYIYKLNVPSGSIAKLTSSQGYSPDYYSGNEKIIYTNRTKGNGRLWSMDKNGNDKTQLTH